MAKAYKDKHEYPYPYKIGTIVPLNISVRYDEIIFVYGDSFADIGCVGVADDLPKTWSEMLAHSISYNVRSFGVSAGSQQLIFDIFKKTLKLKRSFTIIFHTDPTRDDRYNLIPLPHLKYSDYKMWDSLLDEKTLHIHRDKNHQVYDFKNGKTLFCPYWENKKTNLKVQFKKCDRVAGSGHLTYYGNLLLTRDIVEIIGDELRFND